MIQMLPPLKEHRFAYQFEPWRELEAVVLEHGLEFRLGNVSSILYFVGIGCVVNIGLDEQDVVNYRSSYQCAPYFNAVTGKGSLSCSPHFPSLGAL